MNDSDYGKRPVSADWDGTGANEPRLVEAILNELGSGVVVLDVEGRVKHANWIAKTILGPCESEVGKLIFPVLRTGDRELWDYALQESRRGQRSMLHLHLNDGPTTITVSPCRDLPDLALVVFERRSIIDSHSMEYLVREYKLTPAEQRVVSGLMRGDVPKQIAKEQGIAVSTIRTQIKHTLAKTHARGICDLILKIARLPNLPLRKFPPE